MNLREIMDNLHEAQDSIAEITNRGAFGTHLDKGQQQMVAEAQVRIAQVLKELTEFNDPELVDELLDEYLDGESECDIP